MSVTVIGSNFVPVYKAPGKHVRVDTVESPCGEHWATFVSRSWDETRDRPEEHRWDSRAKAEEGHQALVVEALSIRKNEGEGN